MMRLSDIHVVARTVPTWAWVLAATLTAAGARASGPWMGSWVIITTLAIMACSGYIIVHRHDDVDDPVSPPRRRSVARRKTVELPSEISRDADVIRAWRALWKGGREGGDDPETRVTLEAAARTLRKFYVTYRTYFRAKRPLSAEGRVRVGHAYGRLSDDRASFLNALESLVFRTSSSSSYSEDTRRITRVARTFDARLSRMMRAFRHRHPDAVRGRYHGPPLPSDPSVSWWDAAHYALHA